MADNKDNSPEHLGKCESCGKPIMPGDLATFGGPASLWLCGEHSPMLSDQINGVVGIIEDGSWEEFGFDSVEAAKEMLDRLEAEFSVTGDHSMATVHHG